MFKHLSIFTSFLMVVFMFSALTPASAKDNQKHSEHNHIRSVTNCPTSHQLRTLSGHKKDHLRYLCVSENVGDTDIYNIDYQLTIREAIDAIGNSDIYYKDDRRKGFLVRFPGELIFANGSAELPNDAKDTLRRFANVINHYNNAITVNGHASTPNINTTQYPSNQVLSEARAMKVRDYLINSLGVESHRVLTRGYGEDFPYNVEIDDASERLNRRVDFYVKY